MQNVLDWRHRDLDAQLKQLDDRVARHSRSYQCRCGSRVFFRNTLCLACNSQLGYLADEGRVAALEPGSAPGTWQPKAAKSS